MSPTTVCRRPSRSSAAPGLGCPLAHPVWDLPLLIHPNGGKSWGSELIRQPLEEPEVIDPAAEEVIRIATTRDEALRATDHAQVVPDIWRGVDRLDHAADLAGSVRGCVEAAVAGVKLETGRLDPNRGDVTKLLEAQAREG